MNRARNGLTPATLLWAAWAFGCASNTPEPSATRQSSAQREQDAADRMTDPQLVGVARALNDAEVDLAILAQSNASTEPVREFATMLATDHAASNDRLAQLAQRIQMLPEESAKSRGLREQARAQLERLRPLSGEEFDRTFVRITADAHQQALDLLDQVTPDARDNELAELLGELRTRVATHLVRARQLLSSPPLAARERR